MRKRLPTDSTLWKRFKKREGVKNLFGCEEAPFWLSQNQTVGIPRYWDSKLYTSIGMCTLKKPRKELEGRIIHSFGRYYFPLSNIMNAIWCIGRRRKVEVGFYRLRKNEPYSVLSLKHGKKRILLASCAEKLRSSWEWKDVFTEVPPKLMELNVWNKLAENGNEESS